MRVLPDYRWAAEGVRTYFHENEMEPVQPEKMERFEMGVGSNGRLTEEVLLCPRFVAKHESKKLQSS